MFATIVYRPIRLRFSVGRYVLMVLVGIVAGWVASVADAVQVRDPSFRAFNRENVPSPGELFQAIANLQGRTLSVPELDDVERERLSDLASVAKNWFSSQSPEQQEQIVQQLRDPNLRSTLSTNLERSGISKEAQKYLAGQFDSPSFRSSADSSDSDQRESQGQTRRERPSRNANGLNKGNRVRPGRDAPRENLNRLGSSTPEDQVENDDAGANRTPPVRSRSANAQNSDRSGRNPSTSTPKTVRRSSDNSPARPNTTGSPSSDSEFSIPKGMENQNWESQFERILSGEDLLGNVDSASTGSPLGSGSATTNKSENDAGASSLLSRLHDTIVKTPVDSVRSKERYQARFDRLLLDAAIKSLETGSEPGTETSFTKSVDSIFDQLIENVQHSVARKKAPAMRAERERVSSPKVTSRSSVQELFSPSRANRSDAGRSDVSGGVTGGNVANPVQGFWRLAVGAAVVLLVIGLAYWIRFKAVANPEFRRRKRIRIAMASFRSQQGLVESVDGFLVWKFGDESRWWNARTAEDALIAGAPEYEPRIFELFQWYRRARYSRAVSRLTEEQQVGHRATIEELVRRPFAEASQVPSGNGTRRKSGGSESIGPTSEPGDEDNAGRSSIAGALVFIALVLNVGSAFSQDSAEKVSENAWKRGYHGIHLLAEGLGLVHDDLREWKQRPPQESVLIVFGSLQNLPVDVARFVDRGGAVLVASDRQSGRRFDRVGIQFLEFEDLRSNRGYGEFDDCPEITKLATHPTLEGVQSLVTNRPGVLRLRGEGRVLARFSGMKTHVGSPDFIAIVETRNRGKVIGIADQSMFSNQMLMLGDNVRFAHQALKWMKSDGRTHLLVLSDSRVEANIDPAEVSVLPPPPTRDEVLNALKNLPPAALLEFGDSVAAMVEDDDMVNEFLIANMDKVPPKAIRRFLIFTLLGVIGIVLVGSFFFQKRLMRTTASEVAFLRAKRPHKRRVQSLARERQRAAMVLMDRFRLKLVSFQRRPDEACNKTNPRSAEPTAKPTIENVPKSVIVGMESASLRMKNKMPRYWTTERLLQLESDIQEWATTLDAATSARASADPSQIEHTH